MRLSQIQDFIAIAEQGSVRAGAKARQVSAPALTKSLRALEDELHVPLLTRTGRGVVLTRYGTAFLHRAKLIANEARKVSEEMAQMLGGQGSNLCVGATGGPAYALLPGALRRFQTQHPSVQVNLEGGIYPTHTAKLRSGDMDMAISPVPDVGVGTGLSCEPLYRNDSVVAAHPLHPLRHASTLGELAEAEWLLTGQGLKGPGSAIVQAFESQGLGPPRVALRCDNIGTAQMLLLTNPKLLCLLPRKLVCAPPLDRFLIALPLTDTLPSHMVSLIYPSDLPMTPVAADFATLLRREAHYLRQESPETRA